MKLLLESDYILVFSNVADSEYADWDSNTSYTTGDICYVSTKYGEYKALTDNTNKYPPDNPTDWEFVGTTNKFKMFDQYLNTKTTNQDTIDITLNSFGAKGIFLGNIKASFITIQVISNSDGTVLEDNTFNMQNDPIDWEDYFYGDWIYKYKKNIYYDRTTLLNDISFKILIDNTGSIAECGICFLGETRYIGASIFGLNLSALDYSTISIDQATGDTYLEQGNYSKLLNIDIQTQTSGIDSIYDQLVSIRGLPVVFIGEKYDSLSIFGYLKKFETIISDPVMTKITMNINGLI